MINFFVVAHESRMLVDFSKYKNISKKLIIPLDRANKILGKSISKKAKNYGFMVKKDNFNLF